MPRASGSGSGGEVVEVDLWAMAADLERQFAGYKQRLAERDGAAREHDGGDAAAASHDDGGGDEAEAEAGGRGSCSSCACDVRGRMYEAYVRRRDERLRDGWRARMERKEAEVKALWAQLELTGRAGAGGDPTATTTAAGGDYEVGNFCYVLPLTRTNERRTFLLGSRGCCHDTLPFRRSLWPPSLLDWTGRFLTVPYFHLVFRGFLHLFPLRFPLGITVVSQMQLDGPLFRGV
jgi:hypothetical protein